jgi:hypothetical protein
MSEGLAVDANARRGRGRPKGSLNKKTLVKQAELEEESDVQESEPELDVPVQEPEVPSCEEVKQLSGPRPSKPPPKPKIPERAPESDSEEAEPLQEEREESDAEPLQPRPKKKAVEAAIRAAPLKKRPRAQRAPQVSEPPMSYMQVLQRGLAAARTAQKLERVQR